jgi:hypothetical protein
MLVLKPSEIAAGVGVFTTAPIAKGAHVRLWGEGDSRFVAQAEADADPEIREARDIHCVVVEGGYVCPLDFHRMSMGWYMNHSFAPNIASDETLGWEFHATRDIAAGEELFCDYRTLSPFETVPGDFR